MDNECPLWPFEIIMVNRRKLTEQECLYPDRRHANWFCSWTLSVTDWLLDIGTLVQCTKGLSGASRVTDRTVSSAPVSEDPRLTPSGCHCNTTTGTFEGLHWNQCVWSDHPDQASPLWLEIQMTVVLHPMNARHCRAHLQWPRWHVGRAIQQWLSVMFIVESRITLHRNDGQQHAWRRRGVCHALSTWSQHWSRTPQSISGVVRLCPHHHVTSRKPKLLWSQNGAPFCKQYSTSSEECKPEMFFFFFLIYIYIFFNMLFAVSQK